ncbi:MAG: hypothetical protein GY789_14765 [Hyphomicrobiales bacterium]|nr:hypothetical protein [Hyphomicrobiales bacterium]MCP4998582.1 hypothetical protein [Hyphomicrobiales bacterium]
MSVESKQDLDAALIDAHRQSDGRKIAELYLLAGELAQVSGDTEKACFYLVHAYVFALQEGMELASELHARLKVLGREL